MATFPLFQSVEKDSTPFAGTMADTSTPTPMGTQPQVPEVPEANELPGNSGDRVRLEKIQQDRQLIANQLNTLKTMRWVNKNNWSRRFNLALTGQDMEPAQMMYKRYEAMEGLLRIDAQLAQEERILTEPSPVDQAAGKEARDRERRSQQMQFYETFASANGIPLPPQWQLIKTNYIETSYGLKEAITKPEDEIKGLIDSAQLGEEVGEEGVTQLGITGKKGIAATYGARQDKKERDEKNADEGDNFPVLGLFKKPNELFQALHKDYQDQLNVDGYFHMEKYDAPSDIPGVTKKLERRAWSPEDKKNARAAVAARWPGYEKYFPNFVDKGFTDPTPIDTPPVDPKQDDVNKIKLREDLKKRAQGGDTKK